MAALGRAAALGLALCLLLLAASPLQAFYLPGVAPQDYERVSPGAKKRESPPSPWGRMVVIEGAIRAREREVARARAKK